MKYLVLILVIALVLWLALRRREPAREAPPPPSTGSERMVRCAHCGIHLPRSEALLAAGQVFCCPAHRDAGPRAS